MLSFLKKLDPVARAVQKNRLDLRAAAGLERREVALPDGRTIAYLDSGGAHPPLVLVHGIGANKDHWPRLARRLASRFRILALDLPGFGESSKEGDFSMTGQAEAVVAFADAVGLRRFHLAGSSMGGRIVAEVAHRHADRLLSLWLLDPAGAEGERPSEMIEGLLAGEGVPLFAQTAEEYAASVAFTMSQPPHIPKPALRVLAAESAAAYDLNHEIFGRMVEEMAAGPPTEALLDGIEVPTLITWGDEDRVLHSSGARTIAARMPNATVRIMRGIGHIPMLEDPEATARAYLAFHDSTASDDDASDDA